MKNTYTNDEFKSCRRKFVSCRGNEKTWIKNPQEVIMLQLTERLNLWD